MAGLDRRAFVRAALATAIVSASPDIATASPRLSPLMAERCRAMRRLLSVFNIAAVKFRKFCDGLTNDNELEDEEFWAWYCAQPARIVFKAAQLSAQTAVEAVFMTSPETEADGDAIMAAFDAYFPVADSSFAVQCARDLFTPLSHVPAKSRKAYWAIREYLLTDPDEMFEKSDLPAFAVAMRNERKRLTA